MTTPSVGARACVLADVLAALLEDDRELAGRLDAAQRRLLDYANERVGGEAANAIHRAFAEYQSVAEQRRQLGADVGEAAVRLIEAMRASGFSDKQARNADVWALRNGVYRPASTTTTRTVKGAQPRCEPGS